MKPGILSSSVFLGTFGAIVLYDGPLFKDEYLRYALAGSSATLIVEILTHGIDTINIRSKVLKGPKLYLLNFFKLTNMIQLFRGLSAVVYGYAFSSMLYFYSYATLKKHFYTLVKDKNEEKVKSDGSTNPNTKASASEN